MTTTHLELAPTPADERYPTRQVDVTCDSCDGTGRRQNLLLRVVDCDTCLGAGTLAIARPARSVSPDTRKIVLTLDDGTQIYVGRYLEDGSPDVAVRSDCGGRWIPACLAGITVEDRDA